MPSPSPLWTPHNGNLGTTGLPIGNNKPLVPSWRETGGPHPPFTLSRQAKTFEELEARVDEEVAPETPIS